MIEVLFREPLAPMLPWNRSARVFVAGTPLLISGSYLITPSRFGSGRAGRPVAGGLMIGAGMGRVTSGALLLLKMGCGGLGGPTLMSLVAG